MIHWIPVMITFIAVQITSAWSVAGKANPAAKAKTPMAVIRHSSAKKTDAAAGAGQKTPPAVQTVGVDRICSAMLITFALPAAPVRVYPAVKARTAMAGNPAWKGFAPTSCAMTAGVANPVAEWMNNAVEEKSAPRTAPVGLI